MKLTVVVAYADADWGDPAGLWEHTAVHHIEAPDTRRESINAGLSTLLSDLYDQPIPSCQVLAVFPNYLEDRSPEYWI
jgi:hypothetical protein